MLTAILGGLKAALGFVTGGLGRWLVLGGVAAAAAGGAWLWIEALRADVARLEAEKRTIARELDEAAQAAEVNAAAVRRQAAEHARQLEILRAERDRYAARLETLRAIREEVHDAPESDDGPVAPVLRGALERLRGLAPAAEGGDQDREG